LLDSTTATLVTRFEGSLLLHGYPLCRSVQLVYELALPEQVLQVNKKLVKQLVKRAGQLPISFTLGQAAAEQAPVAGKPGAPPAAAAAAKGAGKGR
jgi:hypothetical protein